MKKKLTKEQQEEIRKLQEMPDEEIDYSDIPPAGDWGKAVVGRFYRPIKETVTIRLDADVLDWLKQGGKGYQTRVNSILRAVMERQRKKTAA
ncbi:MAG: BrnA antitoxin family protein [Geobacteraceae bacterium]|nr:BrnA antitoxin family protein [Geobacteraceae bacterium]